MLFAAARKTTEEELFGEKINLARTVIIVKNNNRVTKKEAGEEGGFGGTRLKKNGAEWWGGQFYRVGGKNGRVIDTGQERKAGQGGYKEGLGVMSSPKSGRMAPS